VPAPKTKPIIATDLRIGHQLMPPAADATPLLVLSVRINVRENTVTCEHGPHTTTVIQPATAKVRVLPKKVRVENHDAPPPELVHSTSSSAY